MSQLDRRTHERMCHPGHDARPARRGRVGAHDLVFIACTIRMILLRGVAVARYRDRRPLAH
jgi:hypothetical protein